MKNTFDKVSNLPFFPFNRDNQHLNYSSLIEVKKNVKNRDKNVGGEEKKA